jgi:phage baseplate assembly protein W
MAENHERFGIDLHLLRNLDRVKSNRDPGNDLSVKKRDETGQFDLNTYSGAENLVQALVLRLLTPRGELAVLGHPDYGSRLAELIGDLNTETTRNLVKLYTLEALAADPRVEKVLSVTVAQSRRDRAQVDINVTLQAIRSDTPLNFVFPFFLERT